MEKNINQQEQLHMILQNCFRALSCPRGSFYPNKNYGSQLKASDNTLTEQMAMNYAIQAVSDFDGVLINDVELGENYIKFFVLINNEMGQVIVEI
jgi:hypothetical protein